MTASSIPQALAALDELYAHLESLGAPGRRLVEGTKAWRDGMVRAADSEWSCYYGHVVAADLARGLDWQVGPDDDRGLQLLNRFIAILRNADTSPWGDVQLRQLQQDQGIGPDQVIAQTGRPPAHRR